MWVSRGEAIYQLMARGIPLELAEQIIDTSGGSDAVSYKIIPLEEGIKVYSSSYPVGSDGPLPQEGEISVFNNPSSENLFSEVIKRSFDHLMPEERDKLIDLLSKIEKGEREEEEKNNKSRRALQAVDAALKFANSMRNMTYQSRYHYESTIVELQNLLLEIRSEVSKLCP